MQYYRLNESNNITCVLCKHYCSLKNGLNGFCKINVNNNGKLENLSYGYPSALHIDPVEKKPLYHFLPSSLSLSLGTVGCNFRCPFCQNFSISQPSKIHKSKFFSPDDIVNIALANNVQSISYTYNEPTIWYQYAKDIGQIARQSGLKNIFVSNGFESDDVIEDMKLWVDAVNIDLKSFSHAYYAKILKADLDGILENLIKLSLSNIWLEITTLLIPGVNDTIGEIEAMTSFITKNLGIDIPWHFSAFHPAYKMVNIGSASLETLLLAKHIAKKDGIKYVYLGNVKNDNSTYCYNCGEKLIDRIVFESKMFNIENSKCKKCNSLIQGVWQ